MKYLLVSIIIPIYNAEKFLEKCIKSVIHQTYNHLELILVNDGSTDASCKICNDFANLDKRIVVINQPNQGVVKARKTGVEAATGDYIGWVDADDWIEPDYIEQLVKIQEESGADIVAVGHYHDIGNDSVLIKNGIKNGVYKKDEILDSMLYTGTFFEYGITPQLYTKLFRADILKMTQIAVDEKIVAGDDAAVVYPSILKAETICVSDISGYHYVQHVNSITKTSYSNEKERVKILTDFLREVFKKNSLGDSLKQQLDIYENYLLSLRQIEAFDDEDEDVVLIPYGGFYQGDKVIIYGAGVLGQRIYKYLKTDSRVAVVDWLDKNYQNYQKNGFVVHAPEALKTMGSKYDYILIANISEKVAKGIKCFLIEMGIEEGKICWFTKKFRKSDSEI